MKVVYFFDTVSPYSALSWKVIRKYQHLWKFDLVLKPVLLAGIMQKTGNKPPATLPQRGQFMTKDLQRTAQHYGQPMLRMPTNFFTEVVPASIGFQRLLCSAQDVGVERDCFEDIVDSITNGIYFDLAHRGEEDNLIIDASFVARRLELAGVDHDTAALIYKNSKAEHVKQALKENTSEALEAGAYGVPTMLISAPQFKKPQMFFGCDRFEQIGFLTNNKWLGPDVSKL